MKERSPFAENRRKQEAGKNYEDNDLSIKKRLANGGQHYFRSADAGGPERKGNFRRLYQSDGRRRRKP